MLRAAVATMDPGKAPFSYSRSAVAATICPLRSAPILTLSTAPGEGAVARRTSARLIVILTGRPHLRDRSEAATSSARRFFPPKPPPTSAGTTRTVESGSRSSSAIWSRRSKEPCVVECTTSVPSGPQLAVTACGSM